jgi:hypothetical protein
MKSRAVALFAVTLLLSPGSSKAARIYSLVNYPDLQNGHTLSGTITTTDDAPDDGLLDLAEILDWEWSVTGPNDFAAQFAPPAPHTSTTIVRNIAISPKSIEMASIPDANLRLASTSGPTGRGMNAYRLNWFTSLEDASNEQLLRTVASGVEQGDFARRFWSDNFTSPVENSIVIARLVPEPSTLLLITVSMFSSFVRQSRC